ncbi:MAG: peptidylprolyl isomerase [Candidatus Korobacteraceae bacterium]
MKRVLPFALILAAAPVIAQQSPSQSQALSQTQQLAKQQPIQAQGQAAQPQGSVVEEIVARVNNSIITQADMRRSKEAWQDDLSKAKADGVDLPKEQDLLRDLIDQQLLIQKGTELGVTADTDVVKRLDQIRQQMHADSMEDLEKAAQAQGVSWEDFKQNLKNGIVTQKVIQQEVGGHIVITQTEIQQFYDQHKAELERPEKVRLSEILISTQKSAVKTENGENALPEMPDAQVVAAAQQKADSIYAQLQKGGDFAALAKANSDGPTSQVGGDLEYFKRGTLSKELEEKVFALKAGQYTQPIRTNQGWVVLEVTEHQEAGVPPLKDVETMIQERLYMQAMQPALRDYLMKLREDAYIDIKPGYIDTGASPNETKPIYTTAEASGAKPAKKKKKLGLF